MATALPREAIVWYQLEHRDPADRLLIASAIELACPLVTYDERILRFAAGYGRQYRFTADSCEANTVTRSGSSAGSLRYWAAGDAAGS